MSVTPFVPDENARYPRAGEPDSGPPGAEWVMTGQSFSRCNGRLVANKMENDNSVRSQRPQAKPRATSALAMATTVTCKKPRPRPSSICIDA